MATNGTACPAPMKATSNGSFQGDSPLDYALPLIILQMCLVIVLTRGLAFLLKPLRQPRVIAEIIGGILLGPSALGRNKKFLHTVFPARSLTVLDTIANLGLLFFLFLVGLELDFTTIRRTGKKALAIAFAGISLPFILGIGTSVVLRSTINSGVRHAPFLVFMGVALSITAFPVLARILAELKLLTTDIGRVAMSAAAVNDVTAWILLALAISLSGTDGKSPLISLWVLLTGCAFVTLAVVVLRPALAWMVRRSPEGEPVKEVYICATLTAVLAAGFVTDSIGIHALFGAFIVGIVVPKDGPFAGVLIEKIEDLISGIFLPLYFVSSGLKTDVTTIRGARSWGLLALVITNACLGKIGGTVAVSLLAKIPFREAIALGFLMNTKGLVELIVLNIGKDRKVLNDQTFAILVLMALFTTFITTPIITAIYKPARRAAPYTHRTVQRKDTDSELRILACFHSARSIPTIINLIESSRGTSRRGRLCVYAMHLMELSERPSAVSMVQRARRNGLPFWNKKQVGAGEGNGGDNIVVAFQAYQQLSSVTVRSMTAISHLSTIHEDIVTSAQQKRAALIVLPFHKHQRVDGSMESFGNGFRQMNREVLRYAPCSVAILVDRGFGGTVQISSSDVSYAVVVLFFGGQDDREALAYALRIAEHPGIVLTVLRFLPRPGGSLLNGAAHGHDNSTVRVGVETAEEGPADEECMEKLKEKVASGTIVSVTVEEKVVSGKAEIVSTIKSLGIRCNLYLVGRTSATAPLIDRTECPELGPVGALLASSEFSTTASALVMQQYNPTANLSLVEEVAEMNEVPDTPTVCSVHKRDIASLA
ncbi:Cation/H(+) antiporter 19 [Acorus calamus]|uniref:Cation/H(+) antiporter 19 n=1 Tax=Acorus calamus TaxID=4465 RepID=A0AAV9EZQ6_ACOCL|nr:Cation/H(+) antiporter 19 [Acorus calamus]